MNEKGIVFLFPIFIIDQCVHSSSILVPGCHKLHKHSTFVIIIRAIAHKIDIAAEHFPSLLPHMFVHICAVFQNMLASNVLVDYNFSKRDYVHVHQVYRPKGYAF